MIERKFLMVLWSISDDSNGQDGLLVTEKCNGQRLPFLIFAQKWLFLTKNRPFWPNIHLVGFTAKISRVNDGMKVSNGPLEYS